MNKYGAFKLKGVKAYPQIYQLHPITNYFKAILLLHGHVKSKASRADTTQTEVTLHVQTPYMHRLRQRERESCLDEARA